MSTRKLSGVLAMCLALLGASTASAQPLADLVPNLFGKGGILLAPPQTGFSHAPHFTVSSEAQLLVINDSLRSQLANIPLPSPASGFTFRFDPVLGAFTRSTDSFGPIYSQRADTIGRGKFTFGFTYSRFTFDQLDGLDLDNGQLRVTFIHEPTGSQAGLPPFIFERDTITAQIKADITSDVFVLSGTYGLLDNLDVSIAIPIIRNEMKLTGVATINHIGTTPEQQIHSFANGSDTMVVRSSGESTGIGDIVLRAKYNFYNINPVLLAAGLDLRLPSGSVDELRGVGTPVVSPVFIASTRPFFGVSPHVNLGFHLSGDTTKFQHEFFYNLGFDWSIIRPVTFAFDILGRRIINNNRLQAGQGPDSTRIASSDIIDASMGFKVNVWKNILGVANVLVPLNNTGLRDKVTPLVGLEIAF